MKLIALLCCAVTIIGVVKALRCYSCFIEGCADPFNATATGVSTLTCDPGYDYCGKQSVTIDSQTLMMRDCAYAVSKNTVTIGNLTNRADVTYGRVYSCTKDLCNGASSTTSAIAVALVSVAGIAYTIF